ncbi:hypothetical protein SAMN04487926_12235 [Paraburkholderia steynii]|uniref:Uncharacterized protein n=1 Tax=Paraburkholderia steynii TaxID=1245441 RepID=A0A7Z7BCA7_9BURK|nr:DUF5677 domain-containing protein [Paraburkholderia steynii]SDI70190.1 hypothetical protein SAMN04487926_12235 [Paraburkholderia steynii]
MAENARNIETDFDVLLQLTARIIEAQAGRAIAPGEEWKNDAQVLAHKLFKQAHSARRLLAPGAILMPDGSSVDAIDHTSVIILARACIEGFITLHWIFQNENDDLRRFRHKLWKLGGLLDRAKLHPATDEAREKAQSAQAQATRLIEEIRGSALLSMYSEKQIQNVLKGKWREGWQWRTEAIRAGFHPKYFDNVYSHYSGYAHSNWISTMQIREAVDLEAQYRLGRAAIQVIVHILAKFVHFYVMLFDTASSAFETARPNSRATARHWNIEADDLDRFYRTEEKNTPRQ